MNEVKLETFIMENVKQHDGFKFGLALDEETRRKLIEMKKRLESKEHRSSGVKN